MPAATAQNAEPAIAVGLTSGELARRLDAELRGSPDVRIARIDGLERADANTLTFIRDARHAAGWAHSGAGAAIVSRAVDLQPGDGRALLVVDDADYAMMRLLDAHTPPTHAPAQGVDPAASVAPDARVHPEARIGPGAVVGPRTVVGARAILHANVVLGADVRIGEDAELRAGVVIEDRCVVGNRTRIHANAVVGADGFGYRPSPDGARLVKIPHAGNVEIGDDVEIGANTNIDRGKFGPTVIGDGTKIDNLVQIGHNCRVGRACIICGASALAGSVTIGDGAVLAGGVGVADNRTIGARARVGARSGVMDDVPPGESWVGFPAMPARTTMKIIAAMRRLPDALRRLRIDGDAGGEQ